MAASTAGIALYSGECARHRCGGACWMIPCAAPPLSRRHTDMTALLLLCILGFLFYWVFLKKFYHLSRAYPLHTQAFSEWRSLELVRLDHISYKEMILVSVNEGGIALKLKLLHKGVYLPFAEMNYHACESEIEAYSLTMHKAPETRIYLGEKYDLKARFTTKSAVPAGSAGL